MATITGERSASLHSAATRAAAAGAATGRADWGLVALCSWIVGGGYLDVWAHSHLRLVESFLTPWHVLLYSGMVATTGWIGKRKPSLLGSS